MARYQLQPVSPRAFATHAMLRVIASFKQGADAVERQRTIDFLTGEHGMDLSTTKSLRYDPSFTRRDGVNKDGNIRIGPTAFSQDSGWLATVVFHEIVHSDQFQVYSQNGIDFTKLSATFEPVRVLVALDEYEGFYWAWRNSGVFGLDRSQRAELERELRLWQVEIEDKETVSLARTGQFDAARSALITKVKSGP